MFYLVGWLVLVLFFWGFLVGCLLGDFFGWMGGDGGGIFLSLPQV